MAPPCTIIIAHATPNCRQTIIKGEPGHHMDKMVGAFGPTLDYYRCYRVYINKPRSEWVVDTVDFFQVRSN
jgi:hypothetical protein